MFQKINTSYEDIKEVRYVGVLNYCMFYRIKGNKVEILQFLHGSSNWESVLMSQFRLSNKR